MSKLRIGFVMDPIESIRTDEDSTYLFMLESQKRSHEIIYMTIDDLFLAGDIPMAKGFPIRVSLGKEYYELGEGAPLALNELDAVFMRKDPPFDMEFYTATLILSRIHNQTLVINNPDGIRNINEKTSTLRFPDLFPETLITCKISLLENFLERMGGEMIVKPLFRSYGREILYIEAGSINSYTLLEMATQEETRFVMAQRYLHEVQDGDKRIILLNGEPIGAVLWIPPEKCGNKPPIRTPWREVRTELSDREQDVCRTIAPFLKEEGLYFAGIDMIGGLLTEINITSPTCLHEINRLNNDCLEANVIDFIENECRARK
jgi:glutathione synthase